MTNAATSAAKPILRFGKDGFDVSMKNDGVDYWRLAKACVDENVNQAELMREPYGHHVIQVDRDGVRAELVAMAWTNPKRLVFRMEVDGKRYVVKRAFMRSPGFKRFLPWVMGLTYFTNVMRQVNAAVRNGCDATQDYYLVAERWISFFRQEVWVVLEYMEGELLLLKEDFAPYRAKIRAAALELFAHELTMDDLTLGNFLLGDDDKVRTIDVSCRPCVRLQTVKMAVKLNTLYGLDIPVKGVFNRLLYALLAWRYRLRGDAR